MRRWWRDERGATAIEYSLMAALMSVVLIGALRSMGVSTNAAFQQIASAFTSSR